MEYVNDLTAARLSPTGLLLYYFLPVTLQYSPKYREVRGYLPFSEDQLRRYIGMALTTFCLWDFADRTLN
jgi:hypothetical protein